MQVKTRVSKEEKIRRQLANVQAGFIKQGTSLYKFCRENGIPKASAFRALNHRLKSEGSEQLRQRLIDASKGKSNGNHQNTD
jgi:hypothetical protein